MKSILGIGSVFIFLGCGIMTVIFGLPERYIERDVQLQELVGKWQITPDSEKDLIEFQEKFPDLNDLAVPWKTIQLNEDGTCQLTLENKWTSKPSNSSSGTSQDIPDKDIACSWKTAKVSAITNENVPGIEISTDPSGRYGHPLYIYEDEDKTLILWNFIGDPDDFTPQDFIKVQN
jgi:hypothetical protein